VPNAPLQSVASMRGIDAIKVLARARGLLFDSGGIPLELDAIEGTTLAEIGQAGGLSLVMRRCPLSMLASADLPAIVQAADGGYLVVESAFPEAVLISTAASDTPSLVDIHALQAVWPDVVWVPASMALMDEPDPRFAEPRRPQRRPGRVIAWCALLVAGAAAAVVVGMGLQRVDTEFVATGRMVPDPTPTPVVAPASGILANLRLVESARVRAGDVIGEVESVVPVNPEHDRADIVEAVVGMARASALLVALSNDAPPVLREVPDLDGVRRTIEQQHLNTRYEEYRGKVAAINAEAEQRRVERVAAEELVARTTEALEAVRKQIVDIRPLLEQGFISQNSFKERDARRVELERELQRHREFVIEGTRALDALEARRRSMRSELERTLQVEREESAKLLSKLRKPAPAQTRMVAIVAPVDGTIRRNAVMEHGRAIEQGEEVAGIAQPAPPLELEIIVDATEASRVKPGQTGKALLTVPTAGVPELEVRVASVAEHDTGPLHRQRSTRIRLLTEPSSVSMATLRRDREVTWQVRLQTGGERMIDRWLRQWKER
jgi:membrane fusion protein, protease secretion system